MIIDATIPKASPLADDEVKRGEARLDEAPSCSFNLDEVGQSGASYRPSMAAAAHSYKRAARGGIAARRHHCLVRGAVYGKIAQ